LLLYCEYSQPVEWYRKRFGNVQKQFDCPPLTDHRQVFRTSNYLDKQTELDVRTVKIITVVQHKKDYRRFQAFPVVQ
jgi:hypothetical protein